MPRAIHLHYERSGSGTPLILVPGLGMDGAGWGGFHGLLKGAAVVVFDPRGTGKTPRGAAPLTLAMLAEDLNHLLEQLGWQQAAFAGISFGGAVLQYFALHYPQRVTKLILISTRAPDSPRFPAVQKLFRLLLTHFSPAEFSAAMLPLLFSHEFFRRNIDKMAALEKKLALSREQMQTALQQLQCVERCDWAARLKEITQPVLLLAGERDVITGSEDMISLAARLPHAKLHIIPEVGHSPIAEAPQLCAELLLKFLQR